jgi:hypothetical protein
MHPLLGRQQLLLSGTMEDQRRFEKVVFLFKSP